MIKNFYKFQITIDDKIPKHLKSMECDLKPKFIHTFIISIHKSNKNIITLFASYAFVLPESQTISYEFGEGLAGQVAKEKKLINISDIPAGYIKILSGLGESNPAHLLLCPIMKDSKLLGVAEIASFKAFNKSHEVLVEKSLALLANDLEKGQKKEKKEK
jgi:signal transduction protein with GAF and PtsI domain